MSDFALRVRALIAAGEGYQRAFATAVGLGRTEAAALGHLFHGGPQTPTHLAGRLQLTGGTVTGLAERMVTAGYVTRTRFPEDRRKVLLALTPAGRTLIERGFEVFAAEVERAVRATSPAVRDEVSAVLDRITVSLETSADTVAGETTPGDVNGFTSTPGGL
jgi:DNA-binding MarR family transcriptional regulator